MIDFHAAQVWGHRRSIERYCRLLATDLTDLERQYNAQTDCGGACAIRAIGKERCQAASSYAGGVRILHGPSRRGVPTTKSESRCRGDGRSIASVMVGRHTGNPQMRSKRQTAWEAAAKCATLAKEADDPQEREHYARMRDAWITLANRCEFYSVSDVTDSEQYPVGPPLFGSMQDK